MRPHRRIRSFLLAGLLTLCGAMPSLSQLVLGAGGGVSFCEGLGGDTDGDTLCDHEDPCIHFANTLPLVIGGFSGIPDECLCGDFDGDGFHSATDAAAINDCAAFLRFDCVSERDEVTGQCSDGVCINDGFYSATDADLINRVSSFLDPAYTLKCGRRPEGTCGGDTGVGCGDTLCGNGVLDPGEECDDGNLSPRDGCSEVCHEEGPCAHDLCVEGPPLSATCDACVAQICAGDPVCCTSFWDQFCITGVFVDCGSDQCVAASECGNGVVEGIESCDDGNTLGGDGCSAVCEVEFDPSPLACSAPLCLDVQVVTGDIVQIRWNGTSIAQSAGASLFNLEFFVGGGQVWQLQISFEFPTSLPGFPHVFGGVPEGFCFRMTATATTPFDDILAEARSGNAFPCF